MVREFLKSLEMLWKSTSGRRLLFTVLALISSGTVFYKLAEDWTWVDALYFTMVTLTTVGYGDLHPTHTVSKIFTIVFLVIGVSSILGFLNFVMRESVRRRFEDKGLDDPLE